MPKTSAFSKSIGLFPGSFDPIHLAHLHIALNCQHTFGLDEVWFVVSVQNPLKKHSPVLNAKERLKLVKAALVDKPNLHACDVEFSLPVPSYTYRTFEVLQKKFPNLCFHLLLGEDNLKTVPQWKEAKKLGNALPFLVYRRHYIPFSPLPSKAFRSLIKDLRYLPGGYLNMASSDLRKRLSKDEKALDMLPERVWALIRLYGYYGSDQNP